MKGPLQKRYRARLPKELFDATALGDAAVLKSCFETVEEYVLNDSVDHDRLLRDLIEASPNLLGFVLSATNDATATSLVEYLHETFPTEPAKFEASLAAKVLQNLSHFLGTVQSTLELSRNDLYDDRAGGERGNGRGKRPSQRLQKRAARSKHLSTLDSSPFTAIGKDMPQSQEEANKLGQEILADQRGTLRFFLETLRRPDEKDTFKNAYIPQGRDIGSNDTLTTKARSEDTRDDEAEFEPKNIAYPNVMPLKAALYFDSADGFGAWTIWMSQKAYKDLRTAKRRDGNMYRIFMNKIKALSHGHFSEDNQKHLAGNNTNIPVFEAKMTSDTRLIYHVDCLKDFNIEMERQVLRIFGIYTHAEFDHRLWDAVAHHYTNGDKEHRRRCTFRSGTGDVFLPATFPAQETIAPTDDIALLPPLSSEVSQQLHTIINSEQYINWDQALMNAIEADLDTSHVFYMSPEEQAIVKYGGSCYVMGRSGTGKTTTSLFKMYGREQSWKALNESSSENALRPRQIFATRSRVLAEKVKQSYQELLHGQEIGKAAHHQREAAIKARSLQQILEFDDDDHALRFSQLEADHFPLFLSFDRLLKLLEADGIAELGDKVFYMQSPDDSTGGDILPSEVRRRRQCLVSLDVFMAEYWQHLPQRLTNALDPADVFAEIIGVIKGSEQTLKEASGYLSRETYLNLSCRANATHSHQREIVYDLFEAYTKLKRIRRDYDAADRSHAIVRFLQSTDLDLPMIHYVHVDEVQDNSMIDVLIFCLICRNPNGFFYGGDTAQTISEGSTFRFQDLKAFMHSVEIPQNAAHITALKPKVFQLTRNYRSHAGIINCAQTIISLITHFWPLSIDALHDERGVVDGPKPFFFTGLDLGDLPFEQFLFGTASDHIKFGADQCVLVRDEAAVERLQTEIGMIGTVMTPYQCKGMEFDDVLIYDLFADSSCTKSQWRVLLNYLSGTPGLKCPTFDESVHNRLSREAIWASQDQIEVDPPISRLSELATTSSNEEWLERADKLFQTQNYMQAMNAYENAQNWRMRNIAEAYHHRRTAMRQKKPSEQGKLYLTAAREFWNSAEETADEPKTQGQLFGLSGECYERAGNNKLAAVAYERAEEYVLSASHYRIAGEFDDAVRIVQTFQVDTETKAYILRISKLYYLSKKQYQYVSSSAILFKQRLTRCIACRKSFTLLQLSDDDELKFLDSYGTNEAKVKFLESRSRYREAAELYAADGHLLQAISACLMDDSSVVGEGQAASYLLGGLWSIFTLGAPASVTDRDSEEYLRLAERIDATTLDKDQRSYLDMFKAMSDGDRIQLRATGRSFEAGRDIPTFLLCYDRLFDTKPNLNTIAVSETATTLNDFLLYAEELQKMGCNEEPLSHEGLWRLLAIKDSRSGLHNQYLISNRSLLHSEAPLDRFRRLNVSDDGFELKAQDLSEAVKFTLRSRLQKKVKDLDLPARLWAMQLCMSFGSSIMPPDPRFGSPSRLDMSKISEKARRVVLQWIGESLYSLRIYWDHSDPSPYFLTYVFQLLILYQWSVGRVSVPPYLHKVIWATVSYGPNWLMRESQGNQVYVILDALDFMEIRGNLAISRAISLISHIVDKKVPINMGVLLDVLDRICAISIVARFVQSSASHKAVTLLHSWVELAAKVGAEKLGSLQVQTEPVAQLARLMKHLLEQLLSRSEADTGLMDLSLYGLF
ncbi:hypothetical protein EIP86_009022 [Pleurotus ostreatoroseus]|nr:hypothetical protein EIP86_009022 [Pleurotus ostreatoroseus]